MEKMKNLSSDTLFYRSFIGLIIGPVLLFIFTQLFFVNNFPDIAVKIIYITLALFIVFQWYKELKYKNVAFSNNHLLIKTYFSDKSIKIPFSDIITIEKAFSLARQAARMSYKITFTYNEKKHSVYFFKALELYNIDDLGSYIGLEDKN